LQIVFSEEYLLNSSRAKSAEELFFSVAKKTDFLASFASETVKKRMSMCGKPAVPNIRAIPKEMADTGSDTKPPGAMISKPFSCTSTAAENSFSKEKSKL